MVEYKIIRSDRKSLAMEITDTAELLVRAPKKMPKAKIEEFVEKNSAWIESRTECVRAYIEAHPEPSEEQKNEYIAEAKRYLPMRVEYYSALMGVEPKGITLTGAKKRFGSCSGRDRISFSWRIMAYPKELVDYVIVHELAHIKHHDHSRDFYSTIAEVMPDHKERREKLKY